ncbi:MAG: hypothetical protein ACPK85_08245 [Methanosarcina sp.]
MDNTGNFMLCNLCQTRLKRQILGSNIFYYCRTCGTMSSEACLSGEVSVLRVNKEQSRDNISSLTTQNA